MSRTSINYLENLDKNVHRKDYLDMDRIPDLSQSDALSKGDSTPAGKSMKVQEKMAMDQQ